MKVEQQRLLSVREERTEFVNGYRDSEGSGNIIGLTTNALEESQEEKRDKERDYVKKKKKDSKEIKTYN